MAASLRLAPGAPCLDSALHRHGGRLAEARRLWPEARRPWIDLSTGINPHAYPAPRASREARARLPDPDRLRRLERAAAAAFGVLDPQRVAALAGAETGLRLLPSILGAQTVAIAEPTYGGHAEAWSAAGALRVAWNEAEDGFQVAVVTNPNNPDGRRRSPPVLLDLADRVQRRGGWLVVDESFVEVAPELSIAGAAHPAVIVLRSFGKMYGLAGLRLGFLVGEPAIAERVRGALGDWPVSADALVAGLKAYPDRAWLANARSRLEREAAELDRMLTAVGLEVVGGTPLFRLTQSREARVRFARLCAMGVLTRPFEDPHLLRFGLPPRWARARVRQALEASR